VWPSSVAALQMVERSCRSLQQLGISDQKASDEIARAILPHLVFADGKWWAKLATVISRDDFSKVLLDAGQALLSALL
jgi:hypothetical protein